MAQVLPVDDAFNIPAWSDRASGTSQYPPFRAQYYSWHTSLDLDTGATDYATCPWRTGGPLETRPHGQLLFPSTTGSASSPVMTDRTGASQTKQRGQIVHYDDLFDASDLDAKVTFRVSTVGPIERGGASGLPNAAWTPPIATAHGFSGSVDLDDEGVSANIGANGTGTLDGSLIGGSTYHGWLGNSVAIRASGGFPAWDLTADPHVSVSGIDAYHFAAFPVVNGSAIDLYLELWRIVYATAGVGTPVLMCRQVVADGVSLLNFDLDYTLRIRATTNAGDVGLRCYIGTATISGTNYGELLAFGDTGFPTSISTVTTGTGFTLNTSTGVVTDATASRLSTGVGTTIGWTMGRDRIFDSSAFNNGSRATNATEESVVSVYSESYDLGDEGVKYYDLFDRASKSVSPQPGLTVDRVLSGLFRYGTWGNSDWLWGATAAQYGADNTVIRRCLLQTTSAGSTNAASNPKLHLNGDVSGAAVSPAGVMRHAVYQRPSTQLYNHHRVLTFRGARNGASAAENTFKVGLIAKGVTSQTRMVGPALLASYTTNSAGQQTTLKFELVYLDLAYSDTYAIGTNATLIADKVVQTLGAGIPTGFDVTDAAGFDLQLRVNIKDGANNSTEGGNEFLAYAGGAVIDWDAVYGSAYYEAASFTVVDPSPPAGTTAGRSEAIVFYSLLGETNASAVTNFLPPQLYSWEEATLTSDGTATDTSGSSVDGEGVGTILLNDTFEAIDFNFGVERSMPIRRVTFDSGHSYSQAVLSKSRRVFRISCLAIRKEDNDSLVQFYNARVGTEEPFLIEIPWESSTSLRETVSVKFLSDTLNIRKLAENAYSTQFDAIELL